MPNKSKRILMFSSNYLPHIGGAELALNEITKRIREFQFDLITSNLDKSLPEQEKIGNVMVYRTGNAGAFLKILLPKSLFPIFAYLKARQLTRKFGIYNMVFALQASQGAGAAWLYKILNRGIPSILDVQEGKQLKKQGILLNFFRNLIIKKADVIVTISSYLKNYVRAINPKAEIMVIPNGVTKQQFSASRDLDLRRSLGFDNNDKIIISASRLVEKNGISDLIEAQKYLRLDNIKLMIVGTGKLEKELRFKTTQLNLNKKVKFIDIVEHNQLPAYLGIADVFVRPSLSEGLGTAFLEAMAAGVPVIGTPVGGILDLIKDGETGLLCNVGDPKDIAQKIETVIDNDDLRQKLISNAKRAVDENYDWDVIASRFRDLFHKYAI